MAKHLFNSKTAKEAKAKAAPRTESKTTKLTRELITGLLEGEYEHIQKVLVDMRTSSPKGYIFSVLQLMEYALPKLSRTEITGKNGEALFKAFNNVDTGKV